MEDIDMTKLSPGQTLFYAIVKDGIVQEVSSVTGPAGQVVLPDGVVECEVMVEVGWLYDGDKFSAPN